jgi:hypothetical protein
MVSGSSITNTTDTGLPSVTTGLAYSFAVTAQSFVNPTNNPTDAYIEFGIDGSLMVNEATTSYGHNYLGFALPTQLNDLAQWLPARYVSSGGIWAVSFGQRFSNSKQIAVFADGGERAVVAKPQTVGSVSTGGNTFGITSHPFATGDPVRIATTGTFPGGLNGTTTYYVANVNANAIALALTAGQAAIADTVDITTTGSGTITVNPVDVWRVERTGLTGVTRLLRNGTSIYTFGATSTATLRGFYASREAMEASGPVFSAIKVFGGI